MNLLAFTGRRGSGKTSASQIVLELDPRFKRASFADPVKEEYCALAGIDPEELKDYKCKERHRTGLIAYGEGKRKDNPFYWVDRFFKRMAGEEFVVLDDLRMIHELQRIVENKGTVYKVVASPEIRQARGVVFNQLVDESITESEMDLAAETFLKLTGGGQIFNNTNEINDLKGQVYRVLALHFPYN